MRLKQLLFQIELCRYFRNRFHKKGKNMDSILLEDNPHWIKNTNEVANFLLIDLLKIGDI